MPLPSLLVFGSQTTTRNVEYLSQLRECLLLDPRLLPFVKAIQGLVDLWQELSTKDTRLEKASGLESARFLQQLIDGEQAPPNLGEWPNTVTLPLTVIIHLVQYIYYFDNDESYPSQSRIIESTARGGIQGFCAGLLTAIAVACSNSEEEVTEFGATALRLALCIGAYVDLHLLTKAETVALVVRWRSSTGHVRVREILKGYQNAYVSVVMDETNFTVTAAKKDISALSQELSEEGMSVMPIGIEGCYHSTSNRSLTDQLLALCGSLPNLSFPEADRLRVPVRSNTTSKIITEGSLTRIAFECILVEVSDWHHTILAAASDLDTTQDKVVLVLGTARAIPRSIAKQMNTIEGRSWNLLSRRALRNGFMSPPVQIEGSATDQNSCYGKDAIAVIGMACKFPGADSLEEFWDLLSSGTSTLGEMPPERFPTKGLRRTPDDKFRFFGNFIRDISAFDHRFFRKSSREAASMDPQQRLILQCAYEAMESSGYFGQSPSRQGDDVAASLGSARMTTMTM